MAQIVQYLLERTLNLRNVTIDNIKNIKFSEVIVLSNSNVSSLEWQHKILATIDPADVPLTILGIRLHSNNVVNTPIWKIPNVLPPDKTNAVLPIFF